MPLKKLNIWWCWRHQGGIQMHAWHPSIWGTSGHYYLWVEVTLEKYGNCHQPLGFLCIVSVTTSWAFGSPLVEVCDVETWMCPWWKLILLIYYKITFHHGHIHVSMSHTSTEGDPKAHEVVTDMIQREPKGWWQLPCVSKVTSTHS